MFILYPSKDQKPDGKPCQETGGKIGKATTTLTVKAFHSKSLQVMAGLSLATTLCLVIGNLDRHLQGHNSRNISSICVCNILHCIVSFVLDGKCEGKKR